MTFFTNIFKKEAHPINNSIQHIADELSRTFAEGSVKLAHGIQRQYSEISELVKWTNSYANDKSRSQTLPDEIHECLETAINSQQRMDKAIKDGAFPVALTRTMTKDRTDRQVTVLQKLNVFVQHNQSTIELLQQRKAEDPKGFSKDIKELSKTAPKEVIAVIKYLITGHFAEKELSSEDFVLIHENIDNSEILKVVEKKSILDQANIKDSDSRPLINPVTNDELYPL